MSLAALSRHLKDMVPKTLHYPTFPNNHPLNPCLYGYEVAKIENIFVLEWHMCTYCKYITQIILGKQRFGHTKLAFCLIHSWDQDQFLWGILADPLDTRCIVYSKYFTFRLKFSDIFELRTLSSIRLAHLLTKTGGISQCIL